MEFVSAHGRELARHLGFQVASRKLDQHLAAAIEEFSKPLFPHKESLKPMRGLQRLSNLTHSLVADADAFADKTADRLVAAKARIDATTSQFADFVTAVENTAAEAEAALGQITNSPPPTPPAA